MRLTAYLVVRAASEQTFMPIENAAAIAGGKQAMRKAGGYYVFLSPLARGEIITLVCRGYKKAEIRFGGESRMTVYLRPETEIETTLSPLAAQDAEKGSREITAVFSGGYVPQVIDGCRLIYSGGESRIERFCRAEQKLVLSEPIKEKIPRGSSLKITAE